MVMSPMATGAAAPETPALKPQFSQAIADLPLMPGLSENTDAIVMFDKPNGRVIETTAEGPIPAPQIRTFYNQALPALGWRARNDQTYHRDGEVLKFTVEDTGPKRRAVFHIRPE